MTKTLIPTVILATVLGLTLAGCTISVQDATPAPSAPAGQSTPDPSEAESTGGIFTNAECNGENYTVDQDSSQLVLTGDCGDITISAEGVFLTVENARSVTMTGSLTDVVVTGTVDSASVGGESSSYNGGSVGTLEVPGSSVSVTVNDAGSVSVGGAGNFVAWSSGAASATDTGTGNTVVAP